MKKIISIILMLTILLSGISVFASVDNEVEVYVNGKHIVTDQPAIIAYGRTLVPLRAICEALNCQVEWIADEQIAEISNEITHIGVKVNNDILKQLDFEDQSNQREIVLDMAPIIYNNRVMVPARAIAEALHALVEWDASRNRVDITLEYDYIAEFNEYGLAEVKKNGKYGYINESRNIVVDVVYDNIGGFSEGLVLAGKDGKWGYLDINGNVVIDFEYDFVWNFSDGYATVGKNGKFGIIDQKGNEVVPICYDMADSFSEGLSRVCLNDKWGYVDESGNVVIPLEYGDAYNFRDGKAKVVSNNVTFYIDKTGKAISNNIQMEDLQ